MRKLGERILVSTAAACVRRPWLILAIAAVLTLIAGWYSTSLSVNTSTDDILSHALPFKKIESAYRKDFPKQEAALIIVDGATGADADSAADNLAVRLRDRPELFTNVEVPGESEFFTNNGLLFLDQDKLGNFLSQLEGDKSLLTLFARDPSLRSVASLASSRGFEPGQRGSDNPPLQ